MSLPLEMRLHVFLFLTITSGAMVNGQVAGPNAVASINGQTMLDCNTNDLSLSNWRHTPDGNSNYLTIATGCNPVTGSSAAYYRTEIVGGNICRLIIANATMQQAGVYNCYDGGSNVYRSLVTVIDPAASIVVYIQSEVVEGDQMNISCSITYNGPASPAPSLRPSPYWQTSSGQIFTIVMYHASLNVVTLIAVVTVQKPIVPVFQCNTVFEITGNTSGYSPTPPPDHFTVGSTTEIDVQYVPSTPVITSRPEVIAINGVSCGISVLTCSSAGNPIPNYRWYDTAENVTLSTTSTLTLAEVNWTYKCEVFNTIRNVLYNESTTYTVSKDSCTSTVQCCLFPSNKTTSVTVKSCNNGTVCDCSQGSSELHLICNATTFPYASYTWKDPNGKTTYSPIYDNVTTNGAYRCTAYFNKASSNYTGYVIFSNGTNETTVTLCSDASPSLLWTTLFSIVWLAFLVYFWRGLDLGRTFCYLLRQE